MKNDCKNIIDEEPIFLKCDCNTHAIEVQRYKESDVDDEGFYVSLWQYSRVNITLDWREKIRWIWHILIQGKPWNDCVILNNKHAKELVEYINKYVK